MHKFKSTTEILVDFVRVSSKHSDYQLLHSLIAPVVDGAYKPAGKQEYERQTYMQAKLSLLDRRVLDIGANTGYFSFAAIQAGATHVTAVEGNAEHASFINEATKYLGLERRIQVLNTYFDFNVSPKEPFDIVLCLNVLHHLGDDFGDQNLTASDAKLGMITSLNRMADQCDWMWFQMGFNWKGDKHRSLFEFGTKRELIDFVRQGTQGVWHIEDVSIFCPQKSIYEPLCDHNLMRLDSIGEFKNRPLFLLKKVTR